MSDGSRSLSRGRSKSREHTQQKHKLFVTNLDGSTNQNQLQQELKKLFEEHGQIKPITVRRSKNGDYSFAFVEYEPGFNAQNVVERLNGHQIKGKPMKVQLQDNSKRRKDPDKGCYNCGKMGHFARQCRSKIDQGSRRGRRSRSRSSSRSHDKRKKRSDRRGRSPSDSSDRDRSRNKRKKERKQRDRDSQGKKKKKHKKHRKSSSDSRS